MPANVQKSSIMMKYGKDIKAAMQKSADVPYRPGIVNLPPGIMNGVAELFSAKVGEYKTGPNQGKPYFQARGTVLYPEFVETINGRMKVKGLQTMIQTPLCQTKTAAGAVTELDVNVQRALNDIKGLFGVDENGNCLTDLGAFDYDIEAMCLALEENPSTFSFTTSERKPRQGSNDAPGVWENWHGICEWVAPESTGVNDQTAVPQAKVPSKPVATEPAKPQKNGSTMTTRPPTGKAAMAKQIVKKPEPEPEPTVPPDFGDLDSLAEAAMGGDQAAIDLLCEQALAAGIDQETIDNADTWRDLADMISNDEGVGLNQGVLDENATLEEPEPPAEPHVGDVWRHKPKGAKKMNDFTVTSVNKGQETVGLKSLDGKTICKGVPWDQLVPVA